MSGLVAVLGATGLVGRAAVEMLRASGVTNLRVGARDTRRLAEVAHGAESVEVDAGDPTSLARFCAGADLVLNCAGPSYLLLDVVARAALTAGARYVDVSDGPAHHLLAGSDLFDGTRTAVVSAGMLPGLANLVPRILADDGLAGADLVVYAGGVERFSEASAGDLVLSVDGADGSESGSYWYGEALAMWRDGRLVSGALPVIEDGEVPYFPGRVTLMPFITADSVRLARSAGLATLEWFNVFTGTQLRPALGRLRGRVSREPAALRDAIDDVMAAGAVDRAGQDTYYLLAFTVTTESGARTAVLRTPSSFRLTAATAVLAVLAVLGGEVAPGLHFADEVLDPERTLRGVRELGALPVLDVQDHDRHTEPIEEGAL